MRHGPCCKPWGQPEKGRAGAPRSVAGCQTGPCPASPARCPRAERDAGRSPLPGAGTHQRAAAASPPLSGHLGGAAAAAAARGSRRRRRRSVGRGRRRRGGSRPPSPRLPTAPPAAPPGAGPDRPHAPPGAADTHRAARYSHAFGWYGGDALRLDSVPWQPLFNTLLLPWLENRFD